MKKVLRIHGCIQKTGSQWIRKIFFSINKIDRKYNIITPGENYFNKKIPINIKIDKNIDNIITPFYGHYERYLSVFPEYKKKIIFVVRDPRDIIISRYFSNKYSHASNEYILRERSKLTSMSEHDGITYMIHQLASMKNYYWSMIEWVNASKYDNNIKIFKYEDLIGENNLIEFVYIMKHLEISWSEKDIKQSLIRNSFERLSGRRRGEENKKHHYRKGISGDWVNYFAESHKNDFKKLSGELLTILNYEKNDHW